MKYVQMVKEGNYRGEKYAAGRILCVGVDLANRIISNGQGSQSNEEAYLKQQESKNKETVKKSFSEMSEEELKAVKYKSFKKDELISFAQALNVEESEIQSANSNDDLKALVENKLNEEV